MEKMKIYEGTEPYIFISYAHKDSKTVLPLIHGLQERGYRVWFDEGIEAGTEWPGIIASHLKNSACVLVFLSKNSVESKNCRQELTMAINRNKNPLIVLLEEIDWSAYDKNEDYSGVEMQVGTLHQLYYKRHPDHESFLKALTLYKALRCTKEEREAAITFSPEESYRVGRAYMEGLDGIEQNLQQAEQWLMKAADMGNAKAQFEMGWLMYNFHNEYEKAVAWYRKAAEQGDLKAMYQLGGVLEMGPNQDCKSGDWEEAEKWFCKAAEQGYANAQNEMGERYTFWYSDPKTGAEWFRKAAEQGHAGGMTHLAECYETGSGVPESLEEAVKWYRKAAEQGDSLAIEWLKAQG